MKPLQITIIVALAAMAGGVAAQSVNPQGGLTAEPDPNAPRGLVGYGVRYGSGPSLGSAAAALVTSAATGSLTGTTTTTSTTTSTSTTTTTGR